MHMHLHCWGMSMSYGAARVGLWQVWLSMLRICAKVFRSIDTFVLDAERRAYQRIDAFRRPGRIERKLDFSTVHPFHTQHRVLRILDDLICRRTKRRSQGNPCDHVVVDDLEPVNQAEHNDIEMQLRVFDLAKR